MDKKTKAWSKHRKLTEKIRELRVEKQEVLKQVSLKYESKITKLEQEQEKLRKLF